MGSLFYPLLELSLLLPDKEILVRSYQNPVLFVAILSEALAGVKEKEFSTLLTIINSHSELPPLLLRILLPVLKDSTLNGPGLFAIRGIASSSFYSKSHRCLTDKSTATH